MYFRKHNFILLVYRRLQRTIKDYKRLYKTIHDYTRLYKTGQYSTYKKTLWLFATFNDPAETYEPQSHGINYRIGNGIC